MSQGPKSNLKNLKTIDIEMSSHSRSVLPNLLSVLSFTDFMCFETHLTVLVSSNMEFPRILVETMTHQAMEKCRLLWYSYHHYHEPLTYGWACVWRTYGVGVEQHSSFDPNRE